MRPDVKVTVRPVPRFVGRGGEKLRAALEHFVLDIEGRVCVDLGTSTGGFVDCMLQHGAARVYTFDVGPSQMDWNLAVNPRVTARDRFNVRSLGPEEVPEPFFLLTADLSFISLRRIFPVLPDLIESRGQRDCCSLMLVKPQFELPARSIRRGGLVRSAEEGRQVVEDLIADAGRYSLHSSGIFPSPLKGAEGNQEYFVLFERDKERSA